ncbi:MAG: ParB/RepB/Spo0J family partition protein [Spirochaetota bacterium]
MLGKGLESLIPKKSASDSQDEPAIFQPQTQKGEKSYNNPIQTPNNFFDDKASNPENFSVDSIAGERPKINERVENLSGTPSEGEQGDKFSSGASRNFDARRPTGGKNFQDSLKKHQDAIFHIEVEKIKSNPLQPRKEFNQESLKELAASIREFGILQPIVISKIEIEKEFGADVEYQLIAGERRLMAAKLLGWERVPAIIRKIETKANQLEMAIVENLQRQNLNSVETARAYAKLQDEFGLTQREVAARIGKSRETIANALRLLNLPTEIQDAIAKNQINESQARLLMTIEDQSQQQQLFKELIEKSLSVRALKQRIGGKLQASSFKLQDNNIDPEMLEFQEKLTELLGAKVRIEKGQKEGKIIISFYSPEEIQGIIQKIQTDL